MTWPGSDMTMEGTWVILAARTTSPIAKAQAALAAGIAGPFSSTSMPAAVLEIGMW